MREANFPKDGYIFRHKTNTDAFSRELYLAEGESLDDWEEVPLEEWDQFQKEQEAKVREEYGYINYR